MNPNEKTRLLIGSLAAAVVLTVGYGLYLGFGKQEEPMVQPAPFATPAETPSEAVSEPGQPLMKLQSNSPVVANTNGHEASVTGDPDLNYEWSIKGGSIEEGADSPSIKWTAGEGTEVILSCKGTTRAGKETTVTLRVALLQPPKIDRFEATSAAITEGSSARLSWAVSQTQKLILDPGAQDVTSYSGPAFEVKPAETTTYTLTASNSTGLVVIRELQLKVVPRAEIVSLRAEPVAGSSTYHVIGEFKGGKAELKNGSAVLASSETSPFTAQVSDLKEGAVLVFTVTNEAGSSVSSTLTFSRKTK